MPSVEAIDDEDEDSTVEEALVIIILFFSLWLKHMMERVFGMK